MIGPKTGLAAELLLPFMLKPYRNKSVINLLALFFVFLSGTNAAFGIHRNRHGGDMSYRTDLGYDLDGDHVSETVTIHQCGHLYQVNIHFTTGRPKIRLTAYLNVGVAGLSVETTDVNNDNKGDLVLVSATSMKPVAVWLNQGKAKFKKVAVWPYRFGRYTGPVYRHRQTSQPVPVGTVSLDPLPQTAVDGSHFDIGKDPVARLYFEADELPVGFNLRQVHPRGPPRTTRV
jgi:hypothetical protein